MPIRGFIARIIFATKIILKGGPAFGMVVAAGRSRSSDKCDQFSASRVAFIDGLCRRHRSGSCRCGCIREVRHWLWVDRESCLTIPLASGTTRFHLGKRTTRNPLITRGVEPIPNTANRWRKISKHTRVRQRKTPYELTAERFQAAAVVGDYRLAYLSRQISLIGIAPATRRLGMTWQHLPITCWATSPCWAIAGGSSRRASAARRAPCSRRAVPPGRDPARISTERLRKVNCLPPLRSFALRCQA